MLSFSSLTVLAIAAQSLFTGVHAAVLPKRQSVPPSQGAGDSLDIFASLNLSSTVPGLDLSTTIAGLNLSNIIDGLDLSNTIAGLNLSSIIADLDLIGIGPLNINVTIGSGGDRSTILQQLIPTVLDGLLGPGTNVNVTVVVGQSPLSIGLGLILSDATGAGGVDTDTILSQIIGPLSRIISTVLGENFSIIRISSPGLPTGSLPSSLPAGVPSGFPSSVPLPTQSFPPSVPLPFPTGSLPSGLPFPTDSIPSNFTSCSPSGVPIPTKSV